MVAVLSGTHTISPAGRYCRGSLVVAESGNGVLNITGNISDDNGQRSLTLTGDGSGQLVLSGTNSYGGGTNVNAGTMYVTNSSALPPATNLAVAPAAHSSSILTALATTSRRRRRTPPSP